MMDPVDEIRRSQAATPKGEDGEQIEPRLMPALSQSDIDGLASELGVSLPADQRASVRSGEPAVEHVRK
jgi:hypothetical protein